MENQKPEAPTEAQFVHFPWVPQIQSQLIKIENNLNKDDYCRLLKKFEGLISIETMKLRRCPNRALKCSQLVVRPLLAGFKSVNLTRRLGVDIFPAISLILTHYINLINCSVLKKKNRPETIASSVYVFVKSMLEGSFLPDGSLNNEYILETILSSNIIDESSKPNSFCYYVLLKIMDEEKIYTEQAKSFLKFLAILKVVQDCGGGKLVRRTLNGITEIPVDLRRHLKEQLDVKTSDGIDWYKILEKINIIQIISTCKERLTHLTLASLGVHEDEDESDDSTDGEPARTVQESFYLDTRGTFEDGSMDLNEDEEKSYEYQNGKGSMESDEDIEKSLEYENAKESMELAEGEEKNSGYEIEKGPIESDEEEKDSERENTKGSMESDEEEKDSEDEDENMKGSMESDSDEEEKDSEDEKKKGSMESDEDEEKGSQDENEEWPMESEEDEEKDSEDDNEKNKEDSKSKRFDFEVYDADLMIVEENVNHSVQRPRGRPRVLLRQGLGDDSDASARDEASSDAELIFDEESEPESSSSEDEAVKLSTAEGKSPAKGKVTNGPTSAKGKTQQEDAHTIQKSPTGQEKSPTKGKVAISTPAKRDFQQEEVVGKSPTAQVKIPVKRIVVDVSTPATVNSLQEEVRKSPRNRKRPAKFAEQDNDTISVPVEENIPQIIVTTPKRKRTASEVKATTEDTPPAKSQRRGTRSAVAALAGRPVPTILTRSRTKPKFVE